MIIAYIVTVFVLINGFQMHKLFQTTIFAIVNAIVNFVKNAIDGIVNFFTVHYY